MAFLKARTAYQNIVHGLKFGNLFSERAWAFSPRYTAYSHVIGEVVPEARVIGHIWTRASPGADQSDCTERSRAAVPGEIARRASICIANCGQCDKGPVQLLADRASPIDGRRKPA